MKKSAGMMRRVRRAAGAAAFDAAVSARDENSSVASDKYKKFNAARAKEMARVGGEPDSDSDQLPLLSEKLRLIEQQPQSNNRRGPMMDSDHSDAPLKKKKASSKAAPSSGNSIGSLQKMQVEISAAKRGDTNRQPQLQKKKMNMVLSAFGDSPRLFRRVKKVMKCTKKEDEEFDRDADDLDSLNMSDDANSKSTLTSKVIFAMVLMVLLVFNLGRLKGREKEESLLLSILNNPKLRGQSVLDGSNSISENQPNSESINQAEAVEVFFPSYFSSLSDLTEEYRPGEETPYFWDVHFSGESIAEAIFSQCHNLIMAAEFGLRQPQYSEDELALFNLDGSRYVNVELTSKEGILRASNLGLAQSHLADVIISPYLHNIASLVFTAQNPGRLFALFRHPVDRALSMYHYLSKASWDPMYSPEVKDMTIEEFARSGYIENNWMTRFLVGKPKGKLSHLDMLLAKKIVKYKVLVGLFDELDTSMARFQRYFGWKDPKKTRANTAKCRSKAISRGDKHLAHPSSIKDGEAFASLQSNNPNGAQEVIVGNQAWKAIERQNVFDLELYAFAQRVYTLQGEHIFDVVA
mmetsp:Transcript_27351/g.42973  ORF Transcript_27351/g.42973 Transcript_27351/m.42973 type:complete len:579 (+) Transcript_27351:218-1954(+)|eukprot:CAMPEP_0201729694 /NCGR_PEP_ID=MMETSP0593-20130828/19745_1 /ASSEMBLY_ACC=CAM_ASM_000672 /TAXON_ID=267983 /ORGANISM="Skeletonema japonicum, Strain CCMP2506" /LENGTH=578 /DNA_ID=CAMNT_0048222079 /DNA_START=189 /DNA_END=1925 /DNA_ORIENTATION=+